MHERDDASLFAADLRALLPALRRHLTTLGAGVSPAQRAAALGELRRVAGTAAELSAAFHVTDCALVAGLLVGACAAPNPPLAALTDALAYLDTRAGDLAQPAHTPAPTPGADPSTSTTERLALARLLARLAPPAVSDFPDSPHSSRLAGAPGDAEGDAEGDIAARPTMPPARGMATLSDEEAAIVRAFQAAPLPQARRGPPAPRPTAATDQLDDADDLDDDNTIPSHIRELSIFEIGEDLQELRRTVLAFEQTPSEDELIETMGQLAHKIKGVAGMLAFSIVADLFHIWGGQVAVLRSHQVAADLRAAGILIQGLEALEQAYAAIAAGQDPPPDAPARMHDLSAALLAGPHPTAPGPLAAPAIHSAPLGTSGGLGSPNSPSLGGSGGLHPPAEPLLRVDLRRMDDLSRRIGALAANRGEMIQARAAVATMQTELERALTRLGELSARLTDLRPLATAPTAIPPAATSLPYSVARLLANLPGSGALTMPPAPSMLPATHLTPLIATGAALPTSPAPSGLPERPEVEPVTEYDELALALTEAIGDVISSGNGLRAALATLDKLAQAQEGLAESIQRAIMQVRLIPLQERLLPLHHIVRQLAAEQGNRVTLQVRGEKTEIDREVSEGLGEALTQIVRNAIAHGIEPPAERLERGKPAEGVIHVYAYNTGNEVNIQVRDDGRGINPDALIAVARLNGLLDAETAHAMRPADALNLIFAHGFSTRNRATPTAGHGIGMADVAATLARLHGAIQVRSTPGQGTMFHLRVPVSFSTVQALEVRAAGQGYIVPAVFVQQTVPLPPRDTPDPAATSAPGAQRRLRVTLEGDDMDLPVYPLAELLGRPYLAAPRESALVMDLGSRRAALVVESVAADSEVVVRSLPRHLQRRAVRGATVTSNGEVLLVLDLPDLVARVLAEGRPRVVAPPPAAMLPASPAKPSLMVVDDSPTMRASFSAAFASAGYDVRIAHDGMEALELILSAPPRVIFLDIEMPRLDGYELLTLLRARPELAGVRVAIVTSKGAERHRRHAELLGADAFLVKPCTDETLLATASRLLALPTG